MALSDAPFTTALTFFSFKFIQIDLSSPFILLSVVFLLFHCHDRGQVAINGTFSPFHEFDFNQNSSVSLPMTTSGSSRDLGNVKSVWHPYYNPIYLIGWRFLLQIAAVQR
jgi:uncharacterized membrane protein YfhO